MPIGFGGRLVELCLKACWESELRCSLSPLLHSDQTLPSFERIELLTGSSFECLFLNRFTDFGGH
jgi:hypothetical protein